MSIDPGKIDGIPNIPERIAIALSGGGSRAAVFHLGTMDYLDRCGLLPRVRMISTVSGGSFTGAKYAMCLTEPGSDYNRFFGDFYSDLYNTRAVANAFKRLGGRCFTRDEYLVPSGRCSLITAAADVYAHTFLASKLSGKPWTFGQLLQAQDTNPDYPLDVVVLNATEYARGLAFRFARKKGGKSLSRRDGFVDFGNAFTLESADDAGDDIHRIHLQEAKDIRIADIVAASSCLPGMFEPILFPIDFSWPGGKVPPRIAETFRVDSEKRGAPSRNSEPRGMGGPVPLMDGGIYDNQGIESLMLADQNTNLKRLSGRLRTAMGEEEPNDPERFDLPPPPDLFIVSDADREEDNIYPVCKDRSSPGGKRKRESAREPLLRRLPQWMLVALALFLSGISLTAGGIAAWRLLVSDTASGLSAADTLVYSSALLLALPTALALVLGIRRLRQTISKVPQAGVAAWLFFLNARVGQMIDTLAGRWRSAKATFQDVMPLRTRNLGYWVFYSDPRYRGRRLSNRIYDLQTSRGSKNGQGSVRRRTREILEQAGTALPSDKLCCCIDNAATMETAFWFRDADWQIPALLTCGQATICFNLMKYLMRRHGKDPEQYPNEVKELWGRLHADWDLMREDPYALVKDRIHKPGAQPRDLDGNPLPLKYPPDYGRTQ